MKNNESHIYFVNRNKFCICDIECCGTSNRTIDIKVYDMANNEKLLDLLNLYYIQGNYGATYTYESRAEWFCSYLSSFSSNVDKKEKMFDKLKTNSTVRLLITNKDLLEKIKIIV